MAMVDIQQLWRFMSCKACVLVLTMVAVQTEAQLSTNYLHQKLVTGNAYSKDDIPTDVNVEVARNAMHL